MRETGCARAKDGLAFILSLIIALACLFIQPATAQMYQWKDANGNMVFGDSPPPGADATDKQIRLNKIVRPETPHKSSPVRASMAKKPEGAASNVHVTLYGASWCPYCKKVRAYLVSRGVDLTEYDVDNNKEKASEARMKSGQNGIPVTDVEGTVITGDDIPAISRAIEQKRREGN
ncbi:MAG: DUF4124 domain-containing protein [Actinomycetota bacterium]|nr:DUF4124 domain-containing protein [Actinomycetota bacterium]